jgi:hypothetical protein
MSDAGEAGADAGTAGAGAAGAGTGAGAAGAGTGTVAAGAGAGAGRLTTDAEWTVLSIGCGRGTVCAGLDLWWTFDALPWSTTGTGAVTAPLSSCTGTASAAAEPSLCSSAGGAALSLDGAGSGAGAGAGAGSGASSGVEPETGSKPSDDDEELEWPVPILPLRGPRPPRSPTLPFDDPTIASPEFAWPPLPELPVREE